ncbi:MAG: hypothetical protein V2A79_13425 [Planctomycetota bacterium]
MARGHRLFILVVVVWAAASSSAAAQVRQSIDQRVDGRVLDANNQVGAGGYNAPQNFLYPNAANLFITGNVTGGRAFRGFSPVRDPSSLLLSLPTASLGAFQRDSIGLDDVMVGRSQAVVSPFYLPSSTVTSVGRPGVGFAPTSPGAAGNAFAVPRVDLFTGRPLNLYSGLNANQSPQTVTGLDTRFLPRPTLTTTPLGDNGESFQNYPLADSPLFGLARGPGFGSRDSTAPGLPGYQAYAPGVGAGEVPGTARNEARYRSGLVGRLFETGARGAASDLTATLFGNPGQRDLLAPPPSTEGLAPLTTPIGGEPRQGSGRTAEPSRPTPLEPTQPAAAKPTPSTPGNLADWASTRRSVYQDFRRAVQWSSAYPRAGEAAPEEPGAEKPASAGRFDPSQSYAQQLLQQAPKSFAGEVETDVNVRVRRAEALMREDEFYHAAAQYAIAATLAPDDPLMLLGQGHAYLAAGDYLSAVYYLTHGLERFPEVAHFRLNLYDFVSDPNILDIRRADLETKLERREDYRLRFLLGYAEYYGGLREFGLPQLRRAAEEAPAGSFIARFPKILEGVEPAGGAAEERD